ncbi:MAG: alpha/beta fold hydrolase, partial [Acidobacteria bacterium]|nr:alpha/beta fold hydrolase [Acidobacteriota bacterium]
VLDLDPALVHADDDFFALGGHSLRAARLVRRMRDEWGADVGLGAVFQHQTLTALAAHVDALGGSAEGAAQSDMPVVIVLRAGPVDRPALTCVHPAGGMSWCYGTLARSLHDPRTVYGMQARGLRHDQPLPASLDALARDYVDELRARQPQGPYHLLGWSIGGIIAQAMAAAIETQGGEVGLLAMLDSYPSDRWRGLADPDEHAALRAVLLMAGERPEDAPAPLTRDAVIARLRAGHHPLGAMSDAEVTGVLRVVEHNNRLVRRHEHQPCRAPLLHVRADLEHADDGVNAEEWRPYVGTIDARHVDARHAHMTGPVVSPIVAAWLEERIS